MSRVFVQDCSISIGNALDTIQSCTKPSIYSVKHEYMFVVFCFIPKVVL